MAHKERAEITHVALRKVFLMRLANHDRFDEAGFKRFAAQFEDLMPTHSGDSTLDFPERPEAEIQSDRELLRKDPKASFELQQKRHERDRLRWLEKARKYVAGAWNMSSHKAREVVLLRLIGLYLHEAMPEALVAEMDEDVDGSRPIGRLHAEFENEYLIDDFLDTLIVALRLTDRMRRCKNPKCVVPFFFAEKRLTQAYCTPECARVAQHKAKKNWWLKYGKEWRRKRSAEIRRKRKGGK